MILKTNWLEHLHKIRNIEAEKVFNFFNKRKFDSGLEVGAGDGFQTSIISKYFNNFTATDLNFDRIKIKIPNVRYVKSDGDNFKGVFYKNEFDIIFSSSFLEHLSDPISFLKNSRDYLKDNGYAVHIVPNRFMKVAYILMFYPNLILLIVDRLHGVLKGRKIFRGETGYSENNINNNINNNNSIYNKLKKIFFPSIHGIYRSHLEELIMWGKDEWRNKFTDSGYKIIKELNTSVHSGYGFGFDFFRKILEKFSFSSLTIFILQKNER